MEVAGSRLPSFAPASKAFMVVSGWIGSYSTIASLPADSRIVFTFQMLDKYRLVSDLSDAEGCSHRSPHSPELDRRQRCV